MDSQRNGQRDAPSKVSAEDDRSSKRLKVEDPGETSKDPKVPEEPSTSVGKPIDDHKILPVVDRSIFENFAFKKVLKADPSRKIAFIHGTFQNEKDAVVILEQSAFDLDRLNELFASEASAELEFQNDAYHNYRIFFPKEFNATKTTLIYPATQSHLEKYGQQKLYMLDESPEDYLNITLPSLQTSRRFNTKWVDNILDHDRESDRIIFEDPDKETGFVLLPDLKWDGRNVDSLYLIALPHKRGIYSIRDLTTEHLPMLRKIKEEATRAITEKYGLAASRLRAFLHYQPTFYHLHIHLTNIQFDAPGRNAEKAHMLTSVISNLQYRDYYKNATIPLLVGENDSLFDLYADRLKSRSNENQE